MIQPPEVGSTANSYEILAKLATGGMAELFLARGVGTVGVARYVVLKRILRELSKNTSFVQMFLDEARLVSQLQHPNIAQVHDVGKLGESYFFTMEYVHGETVRALLEHSHAKSREFSISEVLAITAGAAAGLHHAHERIGVDGKPLGIVHRDVTPSNLMVSFEGNVKVVDFGVAKSANHTHDTKSGTIKGKTSYLSPEQCRSGEVDRRSDLFSLGIVMWEMLTTERLYRRGSEFESMSAIVNEDAPPPSKLRSAIPPEIDAIVLRLLARDPDKRFATAADLIEVIEDAAVTHQAKLTATTLARMLRETFGVRPVPWSVFELTAPEPVTITVTHEAIPGTKERQLSSLPEIELVTSGDAELAVPRAPVVPDDAAADAVVAVTDDQPTSRWTITPPPVVTPVEPAAERRSHTAFQDLFGSQRSATSVVFHDRRTPRSLTPPPGLAISETTMPNPGPRIMTIPPKARPTVLRHARGTAAVPRVDETPTPTVLEASRDPAELPTLIEAALQLPREETVQTAARRPRFTLTLREGIIGLAIGGGISFLLLLGLALRGDSGSTPTPTPAIASHAAAIAPPAPTVTTPPPTSAPPVIEAAVPPPVVAATPAPTRAARPRFSKLELAKAYETGRYATVVTSCAAGAAAIDASLCVLAACRMGDPTRAKQWYGGSPAKRKSSLLTTCLSLGVALEGKQPTTKPN